MTEYEKLLDNATKDNVTVIENYSFECNRFKGLYCDGVVALGKNIETDAERACILAEELGQSAKWSKQLIKRFRGQIVK